MSIDNMKAVFEIFTEEIPATMQKKIASDYTTFAEKELVEVGVKLTEKPVVNINVARMILELENCENSGLDEQKFIIFVENVLSKFQKFFPRTILYPQMSIRWFRPIRGLFVAIDDKVIEHDFFGLKSKNTIKINKFEEVNCNSVDEYFEILKRNKINISAPERTDFVRLKVLEFAEKNEVKPLCNEKLYEEIAGMSENCGNCEPLVCKLDDEYKILPIELIDLVLRKNQRYVVFSPDKNGDIYFMIFADTTAKNAEIVKSGHLKVVRARLDDAIYYWKLDEETRKAPKKFENSLQQKVFIDDVNYGEYIGREAKIADDLKISVQENIFVKTKLDLITHAVNEFPELQGVIGGYYFGYNFNPYSRLTAEMLENIDNQALNFYLLDRMIYTLILLENGKGPTSSGDKYTVKQKIGDIFLLCNFDEKYNNLKDAILLKFDAKIQEQFNKLFQNRVKKAENEGIKINEFIKNV